MTAAPIVRHYGMDWLRIAAFALLIVYHIGMMFVPWPWHIKTQEPIEWLAHPMLALNPWRLSLLFLVSGYASRAMLSKASISISGFMKQRSARLLIPLVAGIVLIIPPQAWAELRFRGVIDESFLAFWLGDYFRFSPIDGVMVPTYNHLWFILYLFVYTALLAAIVAFTPRLVKDRVQQLFNAALSNAAAWLVLPIIGLSVIYWALYPDGGPGPQTLVGDWYRHAVYFAMFMVGFALARSERVWSVIRKSWKAALLIGALGYAAAMLQVGGGITAPIPANAFFTIIQAWGLIAGLIGFADHYWNKDAPLRNYLALGVFPFYIIHQTVIVIVGYFLIINRVPVFTQAVIVTVFTLASCWLFYELVLRLGPAKALFGLQHQPSK